MKKRKDEGKEVKKPAKKQRQPKPKAFHVPKNELEHKHAPKHEHNLLEEIIEEVKEFTEEALHAVQCFFKHEGMHHKKEEFFHSIEEAIEYAEKAKRDHVCIKVYDCKGEIIMELGDCEWEEYC
jgi:predicted alternative tryptophan synthase beta-subunit